MDFERVSLLLGIVHNSINVPGTERIRDEAIKELQQLNGIFATVAAVEAAAEVVEPVAVDAEPDDEVPTEEYVVEEPEGEEPDGPPTQEEIKVEGRRI